MAMKGYFAFSKAPALLEPHHQIVWCQIQETHWGVGSYYSAEMQLVYSTAQAYLAFMTYKKSTKTEAVFTKFGWLVVSTLVG